MKLLRTLCALAFALALATPAFAQTTGSIRGEVLDASTNSPIADAVVIAQSKNLQGEQTAITDAKGAFEITLLPTGEYTLIVQREGYQPFERKELKLSTDKTLKIQLALVPESVKAEEVVVTAAAPVVDQGSTTTGLVVGRDYIDSIPMGRGARTFDSVATKAAGVASDTYGAQFQGSTSPENNYIINGVSVTNAHDGTLASSLNLDFVQELEVQTGGYMPEYGRSTGGILSAVTKSGGNEFHGSVHAYVRPFELTPKSIGRSGEAITSVTKTDLNIDLGAELGGYIIKDKLWFYVGVSPFISNRTRQRSVLALWDGDGDGAADTVDQTSDCVESPLDKLLDPADPARCTNGHKTTKVDAQVKVSDDAKEAYPYNVISYPFAARLDYLVSENHTATLSFFGDPTAVRNWNPYPNGQPQKWDENTGSIGGALSWKSKLLNKQMLIEANLSYFNWWDENWPNPRSIENVNGISWRNVNQLEGFEPDYAASCNGKTIAGPAGTTGDGTTVGCPVQFYRTGNTGGLITNDYVTRYGAFLKLTNYFDIAGRHELKYGLDFQWDINRANWKYGGGAYYYARNGTAATGAARGQLELQTFRQYGYDSPPGSKQVVVAPAYDSTVQGRSIGLFAQDGWNIMDKVRLNAGVRVEFQQMIGALIDPNQLAVDPANARTFTEDEATKMRLTNIMPRIGVIYDWTGRGLSRVFGHYGRFYTSFPLRMAIRQFPGEKQVTQWRDISKCNGTVDDLKQAKASPGDCALLAGVAPSFVGFGETPVDPQITGEFMDEVGGGVEYQVWRDLKVGVEYNHRQLGDVIEDMSPDDGFHYFIANPGKKGSLGETAILADGTRVPFPVPQRLYDGVTLSATKNLSDNWLLNASYTFSALRGNFAGLFRNETGQLDPGILSEYDLPSLLDNRQGPLPGDIPHAFKLQGVYMYNITPAMRVRAGGSFFIQSGQPFNMLGSHEVYGAGESFVLPRGAAGRTPPLSQLDLQLGAMYKINEQYGVELIADVFNVFNSQTILTVYEVYTQDFVQPIPSTDYRALLYLTDAGTGAVATPDSNYGNVTSYQAPLTARVGLKLTF